MTRGQKRNGIFQLKNLIHAVNLRKSAEKHDGNVNCGRSALGYDLKHDTVHSLHLFTRCNGNADIRLRITGMRRTLVKIDRSLSAINCKAIGKNPTERKVIGRIFMLIP